MALIIALTLAASVLGVRHVMDNRVLYAWSLRWVQPAEPPSAAVPKLLDGFRTLSWGTPSRDLGLLPELGLGPREVLEKGGPCESKNRLLRALLRLHGIRAERVLLRDHERVVHTVTEVELEDGERMVVDPLYGLYFPRPGRGFHSLEDLGRDPAIACRRIQALLGQEPPPTPPYTHLLTTYCEHLAPAYAHPMVSMIWKADSPLRKAALQAVSFVMGREWVETTPRPYFMERPALMLLAAVLFADLLVIATLLPRLVRTALGRR